MADKCYVKCQMSKPPKYCGLWKESQAHRLERSYRLLPAGGTLPRLLFKGRCGYIYGIMCGLCPALPYVCCGSLNMRHYPVAADRSSPHSLYKNEEGLRTTIIKTLTLNPKPIHTMWGMTYKSGRPGPTGRAPLLKDASTKAGLCMLSLGPNTTRAFRYVPSRAWPPWLPPRLRGRPP